MNARRKISGGIVLAANEVQALRGQAGEVRMDKVKYFEEKLASGTYEVDAEALAGKILDCRF